MLMEIRLIQGPLYVLEILKCCLTDIGCHGRISACRNSEHFNLKKEKRNEANISRVWTDLTWSSLSEPVDRQKCSAWCMEAAAI